jgi:hypothetical protein
MAVDLKALVFLRGLYEQSPRFTGTNFLYHTLAALQIKRGTSILSEYLPPILQNSDYEYG